MKPSLRVSAFFFGIRPGLSELFSGADLQFSAGNAFESPPA